MSDKTDPRTNKRHEGDILSASNTNPSVFSFQSVSLLRRKVNDDSKKYILKDVSGSIRSGHVLAIMGPSGAGKSSFISALTLEAFSLKSTGSVTLNGMPVTTDLLKQHCFVVKQFDNLWPHLTCREALAYAAELYKVGETKQARDGAVTEMLKKMGMLYCSNTKCAKLSGGQQRRLSIATALLKKSRVIFLDEPTSGLDGAAACNVMKEVVRIAKEAGLIIIFTIHQPSTKIFQMFDKIMILSKGQQAYFGDATDLVSYFEGIGYPCPPATNPAEFVMDLVNADFSCHEAVNKILTDWKQHAHKSSLTCSTTESAGDSDIENNNKRFAGLKMLKNTHIGKNSVLSETLILLRRQARFIIRDPILYLGRFVMFFVSNLILAFVYWEVRGHDQSTSLLIVWVAGWFISVAGCMGVVAVHALSSEFKALRAESKNGMIRFPCYVIAKTILVIPIILMCSISSLAIPGFVVQGWPISRFGVIVGIHALSLHSYECVAECLSVWLDDTIMGMILYIGYWILTFVFGGLFIPGEDVFWPLRAFYYVTPFQYYYRGIVYEVFMNTWFCPCTNFLTSAVCANSFDSADVLASLGRIFPIFSPENRVKSDALILLGIGLFWKFLYFIGVIYKGSRASRFESA